MGNHQTPYLPEYRARAIELARTRGRPVAQIARELGMHVETPRLWVRQAACDDGSRQDGPTTADLEELRALRKEVRILREEREILKKAAAFFATEQTRNRP